MPLAAGKFYQPTQEYKGSINTDPKFNKPVIRKPSSPYKGTINNTNRKYYYGHEKDPKNPRRTRPPPVAPQRRQSPRRNQPPPRRNQPQPQRNQPQPQRNQPPPQAYHPQQQNRYVPETARRNRANDQTVRKPARQVAPAPRPEYLPDQRNRYQPTHERRQVDNRTTNRPAPRVPAPPPPPLQQSRLPPPARYVPTSERRRIDNKTMNAAMAVAAFRNARKPKSPPPPPPPPQHQQVHVVRYNPEYEYRRQEDKTMVRPRAAQRTPPPLHIYHEPKPNYPQYEDTVQAPHYASNPVRKSPVVYAARGNTPPRRDPYPVRQRERTPPHYERSPRHRPNYYIDTYATRAGNRRTEPDLDYLYGHRYRIDDRSVFNPPHPATADYVHIPPDRRPLYYTYNKWDPNYVPRDFSPRYVKPAPAGSAHPEIESLLRSMQETEHETKLALRLLAMGYTHHPVY